MMTMIFETTAEADRVLVEVLHQAPIWRKLAMMDQPPNLPIFQSSNHPTFQLTN
jgi:hypothetical protein